MPTPRLTEQEIIAYLGKTSLPTLLVEGEDDAAIYRHLERRLGVFSGSVLFCGGRDVLISIYRQRWAFAHKQVAWLADKDMWVFHDVPADLAGIVFTEGYSIENDLYAGSKIELLLDDAERTQHALLLSVVCRWFAFEVVEYQAGRPAQVAHHIDRIVDFSALDLNATFSAERAYVEPTPPQVDALLGNYQLRLRGKTLMQVLVKCLSSPGRAARHSRAAVVEMCLRLYPDNPYVGRILDDVKARL